MDPLEQLINSTVEEYHQSSVSIAAQWARGSITYDRLFPEAFTDPERIMRKYKAGDPSQRAEFDPLELQRRRLRERTRQNLEAAFQISTGNTLNQYHQNLESRTGQSLKRMMDLPYETHSRVDVLKASVQARKVFRRAGRRGATGLYSAEHEALDTYKTSLRVNHLLRDPERFVKAHGKSGVIQTRSMIRDMDRALARNPVQEPTTLWRAYDSRTLPRGPVSNLQGQTLTYPGYVSTSLQREQAEMFMEYGGVLAEVHLPAGHSSFNYGRIYPDELLGGEAEVLLPRNLPLKVDAAWEEEGIKRVRLVPDTEAAKTIAQRGTLGEHHQNLESPTGKKLKKLFRLPYQDESRVDVMAAATHAQNTFAYPSVKELYDQLGNPADFYGGTLPGKAPDAAIAFLYPKNGTPSPLKPEIYANFTADSRDPLDLAIAMHEGMHASRVGKVPYYDGPQAFVNELAEETNVNRLALKHLRPILKPHDYSRAKEYLEHAEGSYHNLLKVYQKYGVAEVPSNKLTHHLGAGQMQNLSAEIVKVRENSLLEAEQLYQAWKSSPAMVSAGTKPATPSITAVPKKTPRPRKPVTAIIPTKVVPPSPLPISPAVVLAAKTPVTPPATRPAAAPSTIQPQKPKPPPAVTTSPAVAAKGIPAVAGKPKTSAAGKGGTGLAIGAGAVLLGLAGLDALLKAPTESRQQPQQMGANISTRLSLEDLPLDMGLVDKMFSQQFQHGFISS